MAHIQHISRLPGVRRVIKQLQMRQADGKQLLAKIKRAINVSSVRNGRLVEAASINIRNADNDGRPTKPVVKLPESVQKQVVELSELMTSQQEQLNIAQHIASLLNHHFDTSDSTAARMLKLTDQLINDTEDALIETQDTLNAIGEEYVSDDFKHMVSAIFKTLDKTFKGKYKEVKQESSVVHGTYKKQPASFYISYILYDELDGVSFTKDYAVVVTQVVTINEKNKSHMVKTFIRTLAEYKPPTWIIKHPLGTEFNDDVARAVRSVLLTMQSENMIDSVSKAGIPLKDSEINLENKDIESVKIFEDKDVLRVYLNPNIKDFGGARDVLTEIYAELKKIIKIAHPRYRNSIKAGEPRVVTTNRTTRGKTKQLKLYAIDFMFVKPEGEPDIQLPNDRIKKFLEVFDIDDPQVAQDLSRQLKRFLGTK